MNLLSVEEITKSFGERILFENVSFGLNAGEKAALVAKNGNGKSTLMKILSGMDTPDIGNVVFRNGIKTAYLSQQEEWPEDSKVQDVLYHSDNPALKAVKAYEEAMISGNDDVVGNAIELMNDLYAWEAESLMKQLVGVLGLDGLLQKTVSQLSGGQRKRVALAATLLVQADFLLLDEPTNHLDLEMIEWLEDYLRSANCTLLMVTHDRYFLENICNTIFELERKTLFKYQGNFSYYLEKKSEREQIEAATQSKAANLYRKEIEWMRRMPKARGTKQKARVDAFYDIKEQAKKIKEDGKIEIGVKMERMGTKIVELHKVNVGYNTDVLIENFTYNFIPGERIGVVGKNGSGKSSFLKLITGSLSPLKGKVVIGETVKFGHYKQEGIKIEDGKRVIEVIKDIAEFIPLAGGKKWSAAQLLEKFLFPRDTHYQQVSKLSGGEKRRLYLLTVLMDNPNFLILDEPTNDLDIFTLAVLEDYLLSFEGCLLVVSHDRFFMDKMVDHIFAFSGSGEPKDFPGNYTQYREWKENEEKSMVQEKFQKETIPASEPKSKEKKKLSYNEVRELKELDEEIPLLEAEKEALALELSNSAHNHEKLLELGEKMEVLILTLEQKETRWLELMEFSS